MDSSDPHVHNTVSITEAVADKSSLYCHRLTQKRPASESAHALREPQWGQNAGAKLLTPVPWVLLGLWNVKCEQGRNSILEARAHFTQTGLQETHIVALHPHRALLSGTHTSKGPLPAKECEVYGQLSPGHSTSVVGC